MAGFDIPNICFHWFLHSCPQCLLQHLNKETAVKEIHKTNKKQAVVEPERAPGKYCKCLLVVSENQLTNKDFLLLLLEVELVSTFNL